MLRGLGSAQTLGKSRRVARHDDAEIRALAVCRVQFHWMVEDTGDTIDDREAEAQSGGRFGAFVEPREFLEDGPELRRRNACLLYTSDAADE